MPEKKEKKQPLDMTTDEMAEYLFPKEVVEHLKTVANGENQPPKGDDKKSNRKGVASQKE